MSFGPVLVKFWWIRGCFLRPEKGWFCTPGPSGGERRTVRSSKPRVEILRPCCHAFTRPSGGSTADSPRLNGRQSAMQTGPSGACFRRTVRCVVFRRCFAHFASDLLGVDLSASGCYPVHTCSVDGTGYACFWVQVASRVWVWVSKCSYSPPSSHTSRSYNQMVRNHPNLKWWNGNVGCERIWNGSTGRTRILPAPRYPTLILGPKVVDWTCWVRKNPKRLWLPTRSLVAPRNLFAHHALCGDKMARNYPNHDSRT